MTPLLQAASLSRRFGGLVAVDAVSLDLHRGQIHAVIGTNGAGKSTLINLLSGEIPVSGGEIRLDGKPITTLAQPLPPAPASAALTSARPSSRP